MRCLRLLYNRRLIIGQRGTEGHNVYLKIWVQKSWITMNGKLYMLAILAPLLTSGNK